MEENIDINFNFAAAYSEAMFDKLYSASYSLVRRFGNPDKFCFGDARGLFAVMLEMSIYLGLLNKKQRDIIFFDKLRKRDEEWELIPAAHDAKKFLLEDCRRFFPFFNRSVLDEADAILGMLICVFARQSYYIDDMCSFPFPEHMQLPRRRLIRHIRQTAQSIFPNWNSEVKPLYGGRECDGVLLYISRPFSLIMCLYFKYRFTYGRDKAVCMIYGIADTLGMTENENFYDLVFKAIALIDGVCNFSMAEELFPAITLWHIFRVLRRMSDGEVCDEWMTCGCDAECETCAYRIDPDESEDTGDDEAEEADDECASDDDFDFLNSEKLEDKDEDDYYHDLVDSSDFENINSSECNKSHVSEILGDGIRMNINNYDLDLVDPSDFENIKSSEWDKYLSSEDNSRGEQAEN